MTRIRVTHAFALLGLISCASAAHSPIAPTHAISSLYEVVDGKSLTGMKKHLGVLERAGLVARQHRTAAHADTIESTKSRKTPLTHRGCL